MNSPVRQQENPSNNLIKQVEGRGASNVDMPIILFNNSNEFQASMQEIKSRGMIMTAFMKEMKQRYQIIMENLRERGNQGRKLLLSLKGNFLTNSGGSIMRTCKKLVNFHRSPM